jgi:hypothetical protein
MHADFVILHSPGFSKQRGATEMIAAAKRNPPRGDVDRKENARRHQEDALDEALANTFPASDPVSIEQPTPPAVDRRAARS